MSIVIIILYAFLVKQMRTNDISNTDHCDTHATVKKVIIMGY